MCSFTISISTVTSRASHEHLSWMIKFVWGNSAFSSVFLWSNPSSVRSRCYCYHGSYVLENTLSLSLPSLTSTNTPTATTCRGRSQFYIFINKSCVVKTWTLVWMVHFSKLIHSVNWFKKIADSFVQLCLQKSFWTVCFWWFSWFILVILINRFVHTFFY